MKDFKNSTKMMKGHVMPSVGKVMSAMRPAMGKPMMAKTGMMGKKTGC